MTSLDLRPALPMDAIPLYPPGAWFTKLPDWFEPGDKLSFQTSGPDAGRVAATVAPRDQCILDGTSDCWTAPHSPTNYEAAQQGDTLTAEGELIHTANLCCGVNHARLSAGFREVAKRAENTGTQLARVQYHDLPDYVIALGVLWPDITEQQMAIARASALSGDWRWRPELGAYDMAESIFVNNPGFPLMRRMARSAALGDDHPVYIGGMGGIGAIDDELDACPQCELLTSRVMDLEHILAGLKVSENVADVATMLESAMASLGSLPKVVARVAALEDYQRRVTDVEDAVAQLVTAVGSSPRRLVVHRDADRLITEIVEEL